MSHFASVGAGTFLDGVVGNCAKMTPLRIVASIATTGYLIGDTLYSWMIDDSMKILKQVIEEDLKQAPVLTDVDDVLKEIETLEKKLNSKVMLKC